MAISLKEVTKTKKKYLETNCAMLYKDKNFIYKVIDKDIIFYQDMINAINYNYDISSLVNNHIILPNELIKEKKLTRGYKATFIEGKNLNKLADDLTIEEKINLLNKLTSLLEEINNFLIVGDVNLSNCMYDKNRNAYLIDFDLSKPLDKEPFWFTLYNFYNSVTKREIRNNLSTDKMKMAIICASVLYNTDFERHFVFRKPNSKWDIFYNNTDNSLIKDYLKYGFDYLDNSQNIPDYLYIPNSKSYIADLEKDINLIRKKYK